VIFDQRVDLMKEDSVAETVTDMRHAFVDLSSPSTCPSMPMPSKWTLPVSKTN